MQIIEFAGKTSLLPWEPFKLMPLGDVQAGIASCDLDLLERTVDRGLKEGAYFIGMGDYLDVASPSNRQKLRAASFYDSVREMMDESMRREEAQLLTILSKTRGELS